MDTGELEYEEVSLRRANSTQRLGLTLCYRINKNNFTEIFISDIEPGSIAEHSGRIKVGDQILQVHRQPLKTREQAINLFSANKNEVLVLVARPCMQDEDNNEDEEIMNMMPSHHMCLSAVSNRGSNFFSGPNTNTIDSLAYPFSQQQTIMSLKSNPSQHTPILGGQKPITPPVMMPNAFLNANIEEELNFLKKEMETIRLECDRLLNIHSTAEQKVSLPRVNRQTISDPNPVKKIDKLKTPSSPCQRVTHIDRQSANATPMSSKKHSPAKTPPSIVVGSPSPTGCYYTTTTQAQHEESSSAYNTGGDSCRSTPQKNEVINQTKVQLPPIHSMLSKIDFTSQDRQQQKQQQQNLVSHEAPKPLTRYTPGDVMYTIPEHLAETIALQQRLLRDSLKPQPSRGSMNSALESVNAIGEDEDASDKYEWKIKRRADGSCYITRRPLRSQVLKAREEQLKLERPGLSTDDDAASELKMGRFWSREQRKRQLDKARERKAQKLKNSVKKQINQKEQMIIQLSNQKQMKKSGRQLLDRFTTLQEFMVHGSRDPASASIGGILSVTTV